MKFKRIDKITSHNFLIFLLFFCLFFLFSETALKLLDKKEIFANFEYYAANSFSDKEWEDAKKFRKDLAKMGNRCLAIPGSVVYKYKKANLETIHINSLGFRGNEVGKKQKGQFRIGFFGDSRIWGIYLPDDKTIPVLIENNLRNYFKNKQISVLNLGIEGFDIKRSSSFAKLISPKLDLDLAIFYVGDADMVFAYKNGNGDWPNFNSEEEVKERIREIYPTTWLSRRRIVSIVSQTYNNDLKKIMRKKKKKVTVSLSATRLRIIKEFPEALLGRMENIARYFAIRNINTLFVLSPSLQNKVPLSDFEQRIVSDFENRYSDYSLYIASCTEGIKNLLKARDLPFKVIDQTQIFNGNDSTMFYDQLHLTPEATRITAKSIFSYLQSYLQSTLQL